MLIKEKGLQLAHKKTGAVQLNTRRNLRNVRLQVGNLQIEIKDLIKYSGMVFEWNCHMVERVNIVAVKAQKSAAALCELMPNKGSRRSSIRKVLSSVVHFVLLNAALILHKALVYNKSRNRYKEQWHFDFAAHT